MLYKDCLELVAAGLFVLASAVPFERDTFRTLSLPESFLWLPLLLHPIRKGSLSLILRVGESLLAVDMIEASFTCIYHLSESSHC